MSGSPDLSRRLAVLKTEVELDFPGLVVALEKGLQLAVVTESYSEFDLHPELIRRVGGMVLLCRHYGAAVVFVNENRFGELNSKNALKT